LFIYGRSTAAVHTVRRVLNVYDAENRTFSPKNQEEKIKVEEKKMALII
jgi:hypothetical protein